VGVPEGEITVKASLAGTGALSGGILTGVASGTLTGDGSSVTVDVLLRDSTGVCGVVQTAQGGVPSAPVRVQVSVGGLGGTTQQTLTDTAGAYCFSLVPAGDATIDITSFADIDRAHLAGVVIDPDQAQGGNVQLAAIRLNGIGSISGRARRGNGTPVTDMLSFEANGGLPTPSDFPRADGTHRSRSSWRTAHGASTPEETSRLGTRPVRWRPVRPSRTSMSFSSRTPRSYVLVSAVDPSWCQRGHSRPEPAASAPADAAPRVKVFRFRDAGRPAHRLATGPDGAHGAPRDGDARRRRAQLTPIIASRTIRARRGRDPEAGARGRRHPGDAHLPSPALGPGV
jgi:hypothetical protein